MANVRSNLYWSTLLTMSTYVVPLLVFPYISRVLGVERIGMVDTIDSLTDCCILFSMMGMASVGVREIARHKENRQELDQVFTDLFALNLCSTMVVAIIFATAVALSPTLQDYGRLIPIGMLKLVANLFWIEWFYTGIEDFRYITLRSITVRALFIVGVFLLIHQQADSTLYYALFAGMTVANAAYNWLHKRSTCATPTYAAMPCPSSCSDCLPCSRPSTPSCRYPCSASSPTMNRRETSPRQHASTRSSSPSSPHSRES